MRRRPIYADTFAKRRRWAVTGTIVAVVIAVVAIFSYFALRNPRPSTRRYPVLGVQLTQSDGVQNFGHLHQLGVTFAYLKATQGSSYFDDDFNTNYDAASASSVDVGVYHYFSFDSTPDAQAAAFIKHVGSNTGTLPIGVYVTAYTQLPARATLVRHVQRFVTLLTTHYAGRQVVLIGTPTVLRELAKVTPTAPRMVISTRHRDVGSRAFWEYTTGAPLPGGSATKYVAIVYNGSRAQYQKLLQ
ncbi:GH25 family lysozyme [Lacticaseibacillus thailandensis]|uniref:Lysozyme n=1 Tax=Lacticaseibacillus thailandensis DSM 22698 = JCM 13996 TaxID=1423810 RepID=A0A0R2C841_9LACO|nr:GH25 family lysozyme [Lacticaseibacillus thailandensis]KRM87848.1 Lysozyme [Lacticaseibacillus thailandensis DSM 22698 = JCM 13996]